MRSFFDKLEKHIRSPAHQTNLGGSQKNSKIPEKFRTVKTKQVDSLALFFEFIDKFAKHNLSMSSASELLEFLQSRDLMSVDADSRRSIGRYLKYLASFLLSRHVTALKDSDCFFSLSFDESQNAKSQPCLTVVARAVFSVTFCV